MALEFESAAAEAVGGSAGLGDVPPLGRLPLATTDSLFARIFAAAGVTGAQAHSALRRASICATDAQEELLVSGAVHPRRYFAAVATALGLAFLDRLDADSLLLKERDCATLLRSARGPLPVRYLGRDEVPRLLIAPRQADIARLARILARAPALKSRIAIVTPQELRRALLDRGRWHMIETVRSQLFEALPYCSARIVTNGPQGFFLGLAAALCIGGLLLSPSETWLAIHVVASVFFFGCIILRLAALRGAVTPGRLHLKPIDPAVMPTYTVLVALRNEAEIVPELLVALGQLVWPRSRLEIKLVCEADDRETIDAIRAVQLRQNVEIVEVPACSPRTKPKALNFTLEASCGEFVVLFDAEDRPHPHQLVEAWQCFQSGGPELRCLQAPLNITNGSRGMLPALFAFEYSALFRGLLPWLSRAALLLPLGGTSNHFRRSALERIGAWDPFNVTEDADIGIRLVRFGYRTETITLPTNETAPEELGDWLKQRTRWFKGWMQTWLVHMRHPVRLYQELGPASFMVTQVLFGGMILSALLHPFLLVTIGFLLIDLVRGHDFGLVSTGLMTLDLANILFGYLAFLLLGRATGGPQIRDNMERIILFTPVYWLMLSWAAWRALLQLFADPFLWEKTPHPGGQGEDPVTGDAESRLSRENASTASALAPGSST